MADKNYSDSIAVLWQGFRHGWQFNHRVNRMGSFVKHKRAKDGLWRACVVHAAASGSAPDKAGFTTFFTTIKATGVCFQAGCCELLISTVEEKLVPINASVTVELAPELLDKDVRTVVLNGFDLHAAGDADKLMTLVLEVTDPEAGDGTSIEFKIRGGFRVDCSSPECDAVIYSDENSIRERFEHRWTESLEELYKYLEKKYEKLPPQIATHQESDLWGSDDPYFKNPDHDQVLVSDVVPPLDEVVFYRLFVHYLIVAGEGQNLNVEHIDLPSRKEYWWDMETELSLEDENVKAQTVEIAGDEGYKGGVLAFKQVAMSLHRDLSEGGGIKPWRHAKAMHLLAWHMAVTGGDISKAGKSTASVDLFFQNWKQGMTLTRIPLSLLAYRDAGCARFDCRLTLLQFKDCEDLTQDQHADEIDWPGGELFGRDANGKRRLIAQKPSTHERALKAKTVPLEK